MELVQWYNLIFVAPVVLAAIYLVLSATGLSGTDHDLDHDLHLDHDVHVDHDMHMDHDVHVDHDMHVDHDVHHDLAHADHGAHHATHDGPGTQQDGLLLRALSVIGFGKVPLSILITCLMVLFGATGLVANGLFKHALPWGWGPALYFWYSLAAAVTVSVSLTGTLAQGLSRIMPTTETYAVRPEELVGTVGVAVYAIPEGRRGMVNTRDAGGTVHQVAARSMGGDLPRGAEVIMVRYHREGDYYDVTASPL